MTIKIQTEEFVLKEFKGMLEELKKDKDIIYLGELFEDKNYSRQRFSEWVKDYEGVSEIKTRADTIKEILETRAVKGGLTNQLNSTFTIFHLKNNFGWKDKTEVESNVRKLAPLTTKEQSDLDNLMENS